MPGMGSSSDPSPYNLKAQAKPGLFVFFRPERWLEPLIDLVFPRRCGGCGQVDTGWCPHCQQLLDQAPIATSLHSIPDLSKVASTGVLGGKLQQAIWAFKYENQPHLAEVLGERLLRSLTVQDWIFDIIVPVPLHTSRLLKRGYNQAQLLSEYLADHLPQTCLPQAISRQRQTDSQVGLAQKQRQKNVEGAFQADVETVKNRTILLVDDVVTTGATLSACARSAFAAGASDVYGLTVSRAQD